MSKAILIQLIIFILFNPLQAAEQAAKIIISKDHHHHILSFETDYRYDKGSNAYKHYDFGIKIPISNTIRYSLNYRQIYQFNSKNNQWKIEKRPHLSLQKKLEYKLLTTELRVREEFRFKTDNSYANRNRIRLMFKSNKEILKLKPFVRNEWFYDFDAEKYNKNWLSVGLSLSSFYRSNLALYYKYVSKLEGSNWTSSDSLVLKLLYKF